MKDTSKDRYTEAECEYLLSLRGKIPAANTKAADERRLQIEREFNAVDSETKYRRYPTIFAKAYRLFKAGYKHPAAPPPNTPEVEAEIEEADRRFKEWMAEPRRDWKKFPF